MHTLRTQPRARLQRRDRDLHTTRWTRTWVHVCPTEGFQPDVCGAGGWVVGVIWAWAVGKARSNERKCPTRVGKSSLVQPAMYAFAAGKHPCLDRKD